MDWSTRALVVYKATADLEHKGFNLDCRVLDLHSLQYFLSSLVIRDRHLCTCIVLYLVLVIMYLLLFFVLVLCLMYYICLLLGLLYICRY